MESLEIINKKIADLKPYEKNPRNNEQAVESVANSIEEFGFINPIVIDKDDVIVAGHTRYKAAQTLNLTEVPCVYVNHLSNEQIKAFRLADNKTAELAEWDYEKLEQELREITQISMDLFGFEDAMEEFEKRLDEASAEKYSQNVDTPQYEIMGDDPSFDEMLDTSKADELIAEIESAKIDEEEKSFLIEAAKRHNVFNYRNIAEHYAHASKEVQTLMEKSALVIIDYDDAIKYGFTTFTQAIEELYDEEIGE